MFSAYHHELSLARRALAAHDSERGFHHLERAHILAQRSTLHHAFVHGLMLWTGARHGDYREVAGQLPRIVAALMFSRIWVPRGNTGRARVSAFAPMPVPADLRHLIARIQ